MELTLRTASGTTHKQLAALRCETFVEVIALELGVASAFDVPAAPGEKRREPSVRAWSARLEASLGSGPTPRPSSMVAISAARHWSALRLELGASYGVPRTIRYETHDTVGARISTIAGLARVCHGLPLVALEVPLCGGVEAGAMHGAGFGVQDAKTAVRPWAALVLASALRYPRFSRFAGWLALEAALVLVRPRFGMRNLPVLYRPDPVAVRGAIGIDVRFD